MNIPNNPNKQKPKGLAVPSNPNRKQPAPASLHTRCASCGKR